MISASAGPTAPPSGSRCILAVVELAHAGVGGAAKMDHLDLRKQPPRIGRAPHRVGADLETLAARLAEIARAKRPARSTSASPGGSRDSVAPITSPGVSSLPGMSLSECIAACNSPAATASRICGDEGAALAAMRQQLAGLVEIARGFELDDLDLDVGNGRGQAAGNLLGLGQRHRALARADPFELPPYAPRPT